MLVTRGSGFIGTNIVDSFLRDQSAASISTPGKIPAHEAVLRPDDQVGRDRIGQTITTFTQTR